MNIHNFEQQIESKIIDRGFDYYEQDQVQEVEQVDNGEFFAEVQGSDLYQVYIRFDGDEILSQTCDCPYDYGTVCKHVVAVLYYIRDAEMLKDKPKITISDELRRICEKLPRKNLENIVIDFAKKDKNFREAFLDDFEDL
jgi:uncharacterized Zn finger protein